MITPGHLLTVTDENGIETRIMFRHGRQDDLPLLFNSWCNQIRSRAHFGRMSRVAFKEYTDAVMRRLIALGDVGVAYPEGADSVILGLIVKGTGKVGDLHYLFIKQAFRRNGIATAIMKSCYGDALGLAPIRLTHPLPYYKHYIDRWKLAYEPIKSMSNI